MRIRLLALLAILSIAAISYDGPPRPPGFSRIAQSPKGKEQRDSLGKRLKRETATPRRLSAVPLSQFAITNFSIASNQLTLSWNSNSPGPFQIESSSFDGNWEIAGDPTILLHDTVIAWSGSAYRVRAQVPLLFCNSNASVQPRLTWETPEIDMSDSLQTFTLQKGPSESGPWTNIDAAIASTVRQYNDASPTPVSYRLQQTTRNGAEIPYNIVTAPGNPPSQSGRIQLQRMYGGVSTNSSSSIVSQAIGVDASGNVVVAGKVYYQGNPGNGVLVAAGAYDMIIAKYSPTGACLWSARYGLVSSDQFYDLVINQNNGNIYVIGTITMSAAGTYDYGFGPESCPGGGNVLIVAFNSSGTVLWHKLFGGSGTDEGFGIALDSSGSNLLICGTYGFFGTGINFGGGVLPLLGRPSGFLAKLSAADGSYVWANGFGDSSNPTYCRSVKVASDGTVFMGAEFQYSSNFGTGVMTTSGNYNAIVGKFNGTTGAVSFINRLSSTSDVRMSRLALASDNSVWACGTFPAFGVVTFAPGHSVTGYQSGNFYLAHYSSAGGYLLGTFFGAADGSGIPGIFGLGVGTDGSVIITGEETTAIDFGDGHYLFGEGGNDLFLVKFDSSMNVIWSRRGAPYGDSGLNIFVASNGSIYVALNCASASGLTGLWRRPSAFEPAILEPALEVVPPAAGSTQNAGWLRVSP